MALGPGARLGRYELVDLLGRGGMGEVYRARDLRLEREVAVKILPEVEARDPVRLKRFQREARLVASLAHANVLTVYDVGARRGTPYLVTELLEGRSLRDWLRDGPMPVTRALNCATQIVRGLAAAHEAGIVHRDLKPENVFLTRSDGVKILDFGVAKLLHAERGSGDEDTPTDPAARMGTPGYMSPEQVRGLAIDHRSDIFSLGAVLCEMLSGRPPFGRDTPAETMTAILREEPTPLPAGVFPGLQHLVGRCLDKQPEDRFQSAHDLALALESLAGTDPAVPETTHGTRRRPPFNQRSCPFETPAATHEPPPLVARDEKLAELEEHLAGALAGQGRVVFLTGEAGTGKTALAGAFARRMREAHPELVVAGGTCNAHTGVGDPFLPFREVLGLLTGDVEARWTAGSLSRDHATRLWNLLPVVARALAQSGGDLLDTLIPSGALIARAELHSPEGADWLEALRRLAERRPAAPQANAPSQPDLFAQYTDVVRAAARQHPLLLLLDDLQWADSGSVGLLFHLARQVGDSRVLVLGLYRPSEVTAGRRGERHPLEPVVHELQTAFGHVPVELREEEDRSFVDALLDREPHRLGLEFREGLFRQTRGHALFTVELLRGLQEQGTLTRDAEGRWIRAPGLTWDLMPARVEGVIAERVGRLPEKLQRTLAVASVEGEEFTAEAVARLVNIQPREMTRLLSEELDRRHHLVRARGFQRQAGRRLSRYRFRHFLFQKYLYDRLDAVERAELHEGLGRALEKLHRDDIGDAAVELARHFEAAGLTEKAVKYRQVSGDRARQTSAYEEAGTHYRRALELLWGLPDGSERARRELELQIDLGWAILYGRGYGAPQAGQAFDRARELSTRIGEPRRSYELALSLSVFRWCRAEHAAALQLAEEAGAVAGELHDDSSVVMARGILGATHVHSGQLVDGRAHLEEALALLERSGLGPRVDPVLGFDPGQCYGAFLGRWLWLLGYPEQATRRSAESEAIARGLSHPHSVAHASFFSAMLHLHRRDVSAVWEQVERLERLSTEWGFPAWLSGAKVMQGWCRLQRGAVEEAITAAQEGIDGWKAAGLEIDTPTFSGFLAEAFARSGQVGRGLDLVREALAQVTRTGERFQEAELYRILGELLLQTSHPDRRDDAERRFRQALEVARAQEARSWELRAATSLARLLADEDQRGEARSTLTGVYSWFTEGFDTPDLQDARALLDELV